MPNLAKLAISRVESAKLALFDGGIGPDWANLVLSSGGVGSNWAKLTLYGQSLQNIEIYLSKLETNWAKLDVELPIGIGSQILQN